MKALFVSSLAVAVAVAACGTPPTDSLLGWDNSQKDGLGDGGTTAPDRAAVVVAEVEAAVERNGNGNRMAPAEAERSPARREFRATSRTVLAEKCTGCHSDPPINGSLSGLVTYTDLTANSTEDPTKKLIEESVIRMQSASSPMPPSSLGNPATASDITTLQNWISAGEPQGECDAGAVGGGTTNVFSERRRIHADERTERRAQRGSRLHLVSRRQRRSPALRLRGHRLQRQRLTGRRRGNSGPRLRREIT